MTLWERFKALGIFKRDYQADMSAECARFKADQAFQQYKDEAAFSLINRLWALKVDDVAEFQEIKRCQLMLEGFDDFIDSAITSEMMKHR